MAAYAKTILYWKEDEQVVQPFVYALSDLQNQADDWHLAKSFKLEPESEI